MKNRLMTSLYAAILAMMGMVLVSLYITPDIKTSQGNVIGMVLGVVIFLVIMRVVKNTFLWWLGFAFFQICGLIISVASLWLTDWHFSKLPGNSVLLNWLTHIKSWLPFNIESFHPNIVAGALLWFLPSLVSLGIYLGVKWKLLSVTWGRGRLIIAGCAVWGSALFELAILILTLSRSALIGIAATAIIIIAFVLPQKGRLALAVGVVMLILVVGIVAITPAGKNIQELFSANPSSVTSLDTLYGRIQLWSKALAVIKDFPLTGIGMNTFPDMIHFLYPINLNPEDYNFGHAHNEFLQVWLDLGVIGLIGFISLYCVSFIMLMKLWNGSNKGGVDLNLIKVDFPSSWGFIVMGLGAGLLAHMVYGMADAIALGTKPSLLHWLLVGLIASLFLIVNKNESAENH